MSTATLPEQQYLLLHNKSWDDYRQFERMVDDQPGHRLTYDRGRLEFMTVSYLHERVKKLLDRLIFALAQELEVDILSGGSTTFRREDLDRGLEPDQCYYLENATLVRDKDELDLTVDPPPDVVIEVEISRSVLDRLGILAALGVSEVWCSDGERLRFLQLNAAGEYDERPESRYFPGIRGDDFVSFLRKRKELGELSLVESFREWVKQHKT